MIKKPFLQAEVFALRYRIGTANNLQKEDVYGKDILHHGKKCNWERYDF